jgi:hypothetical protein
MILGLSLILFYSDNFWGILSGISFICVAFSPIDIFPFLHMLFAIFAFIFLTIATVQAELRTLTGVLIAFFFNFLIAESSLIQVLNQKFVFYSMVILHLLCLFNAPILINQYYGKIKQIFIFYLEQNYFFKRIKFHN